MGDSRTFKSEKTSNNKSGKRSLIFSSQKFIKSKRDSPSARESLTIYYFDLPVHKKIRFDKTTTIADLIYEAIELYLGDSSLDHTKVRERNIGSIKMLM